MGWTRRANPKWSRKASGQRYSSARYIRVSVDRHGTYKLNTLEESWVGASRWFQRYTARQMRATAKLQIAHELEMYEQGLIEDYYDSLDWYDDEPMDLPDWWYNEDQDYEYTGPEPENDPYDDPYWFDDYYNEPWKEMY